MASKDGWAAELLSVWFDELGPKDWFSGSAEVDAMLRRRFENHLLAQETTEATKFLNDPETALAAILLFDQVPRNIYRDTARAFAFDAKAANLARAAISRGLDKALPSSHRQFIAMPLMHSEKIADQDASLAYFTKHLPDNVPFAQSHHEMIARFGRFPHRNAVLGRETSQAEQRAIDEGFSW